MFQNIMNLISLWAIPFIAVAIPTYALFKKVPVYSVFCEGAKDGLAVAAKIVPYLVCMLCGIGMFRRSGAMDYLVMVLSPVTELIGMPGEILPMGIMRSFSGGGAEGMLVELLATYGPDSTIGRMASVAMGSTETTFYCIAVYFGCIGVSKTRHAIAAGLMADLASLLAACFITNMMWG